MKTLYQNYITLPIRFVIQMKNNALKNIIANVQFGLIEKSYNKPTSFVFDTSTECNHYRIKYGGSGGAKVGIYLGSADTDGYALLNLDL